MKEFFDILDENGAYTGKTEERDVAHKNGLWHRAVVVFLVNSKNQVLLQRRSAMKKFWPNMLDVSVGGHCNAGEFGFEAAIRETREEIGVEIERKQLVFLGCTRSHVVKKDTVDNMLNEFYVAFVDVDPLSLKLQEEEVSEVKYFSAKEIEKMMKEGYVQLTPKVEAYEFLLEFLKKEKKK